MTEPSQIEIVVACYRENLSWVEAVQALGYRITLYNASEFPLRAWGVDPITGEPVDITEFESIAVENHANEAGQWLHHLVSRHGTYSPLTIFAQADLGWGMGMNLSMGAPKDRVDSLIKWLADSSTLDAKFLHFTQTKCSISQTQKASDWQSVFAPFPVPYMFATSESQAGGQFLASAEFLNRLPITYLQSLLDLAKKDNRTAHRFEWSWGLVMDSFGLTFPFCK